MNVTADNRYKKVEKTMRRLGYERSALIETLHSAQESFGYLNTGVLRFVAGKLRLPLSKVYGVATFYHHFHLKPKGKHHCVVCTGTACYIKGSEKLLSAVKRRYGIGPNETMADDLLTLLTARCVGSCSLAPVVVVDDKTTGNVTETQLASLLEEVLDVDA